MARFVQPATAPGDPYPDDHVLHATLGRLLGDAAPLAVPRLAALGRDVQDRLRAAHADAEAHPPVLVRYGPWGERLDRVDTAPGWAVLRAAAARHALVATPYLPEARQSFGAGARVVQHALLHLYGPESAVYTCPVAMSDGAAALLSLPEVDPAVRDAWLPLLVSTDPDTAVTAGQWMTEAQGGSDLSGTSTVAARDDTGRWRLTGEKWFCSAIDSPVAVALARPAGAGTGSRVLAPFLVPRYGPGGTPAPGISVHRLKDKLGTRAVPTGEVGLAGAAALPLGDPDTPGLARMLTLVVVTRLHNAAAAAAGMRRGLDLARRYAALRHAGGRPLEQQPLHRATLATLAVHAQAAYTLAAHAFALMGRVEVDADATAAAELRLVAPLAKAATARLAVAAASEYLECFGGAGYVEDTGVPRLLRDAQVLPIWEGTTNVLAVDTLRALTRGEGGKQVLARIEAAADLAVPLRPGTGLPAPADALARGRTHLAGLLADLAGTAAPGGARDVMLRLADVLTAALLVEQARYDHGRGDPHGAAVAGLWAAQRLDRTDIGVPAAAAYDLLLDRR